MKLNCVHKYLLLYYNITFEEAKTRVLKIYQKKLRHFQIFDFAFLHKNGREIDNTFRVRKASPLFDFTFHLIQLIQRKITFSHSTVVRLRCWRKVSQRGFSLSYHKTFSFPFFCNFFKIYILS